MTSPAEVAAASSHCSRLRRIGSAAMAAVVASRRSTTAKALACCAFVVAAPKSLTTWWRRLTPCTHAGSAASSAWSGECWRCEKRLLFLGHSFLLSVLTLCLAGVMAVWLVLGEKGAAGLTAAAASATFTAAVYSFLLAGEE